MTVSRGTNGEGSIGARSSQVGSEGAHVAGLTHRAFGLCGTFVVVTSHLTAIDLLSVDDGFVRACQSKSTVGASKNSFFGELTIHTRLKRISIRAIVSSGTDELSIVAYWGVVSRLKSFRCASQGTLLSFRACSTR